MGFSNQILHKQNVIRQSNTSDYRFETGHQGSEDVPNADIIRVRYRRVFTDSVVIGIQWRGNLFRVIQYR